MLEDTRCPFFMPPASLLRRDGAFGRSRACSLVGRRFSSESKHAAAQATASHPPPLTVAALAPERAGRGGRTCPPRGWSRDGPLPLGWGAVAVIVGVVTLLVISSAVAIVVVLEYNRSTDTFREVSRKEHSALSESLLRRLAFNGKSNYGVKENMSDIGANDGVRTSKSERQRETSKNCRT